MAAGFKHQDLLESNFVFHVNSGYLGQMTKNAVVLVQFGGKLTGDDYHGNGNRFCYMKYADGQVLDKQNISNPS